MKRKDFILAIFVVFLLWTISSVLINKNILPAPWSVLIHTLTVIDKLIVHIFYSIFRLILGIFIGVLLGWPLGILSGYFVSIDRFLSPIIYLLYPIPKIALLPILMLLFGLGEGTKITIIVLIIVFQIIVNIRDYIKEIDNKMYYPLNILGSSHIQIIRHIIIPATLPKLFSSIRISLGTSIAVLFFSETFGTTYGLGYFIMDSLVRINYLDMYTGIVILSTFGLLLFTIIDYLQSKTIKWQ